MLYRELARVPRSGQDAAVKGMQAKRTRLSDAPEDEHEFDGSIFAGKLDQCLEVLRRYLVAAVGILPRILTRKHGPRRGNGRLHESCYRWTPYPKGQRGFGVQRCDLGSGGDWPRPAGSGRGRCGFRGFGRRSMLPEAGRDQAQLLCIRRAVWFKNECVGDGAAHECAKVKCGATGRIRRRMRRAGYGREVVLSAR